MESLQASLESEKRAEVEGLRIKKKLEPDINEFEIALDDTYNKAPYPKVPQELPGSFP